MSILKARVVFIVFLFSLCFCILMGRLFQIQILQGKEYDLKCRQQSKCRTLISAKRGAIKDRNGNILAKSINTSLNINTDLFLNSKGSKTGGNKTKKTSIKRIYPYGELAGQVIGHIGKDGNGLSGIEYAFDQHLKGENGWNIVQKYGSNHRYFRIGLPNKPPKRGLDVYLTIDLRIQAIVEKVLDETVKKFDAKGGLCIIMDPKSGDILAMSNKPGFNPNIWKTYPRAYRRNQCVSSIYEPGSTFKVVTAAIAFQENIKNEFDSIDGNKGVYKIYDQVIRDLKPYGKLTFREAMSYSSNVCFVKIAKEIKNTCFYNYIRNFGFGSYSGIQLPGEENGIVHSVDKWSGRTKVTMAIGQEISVTLLQMMVVFSAVANGGVVVNPSIYHNVSGDKDVFFNNRTTNIKRRVLSEDITLRLRRIMKDVVEYGTAKRCALEGLAIAGKTGTSQKVDLETGGYSRDKVWASFIGFAPVENPILVCGIVIDEPAKGEGGGRAAAPAFKQILRQIVSQPELEYAERLINNKKFNTRKKNNKKMIKRIPDVCGMDRKKAAQFLLKSKIPFEILGVGQCVAYQSPRKESLLSENIKLILYTVEKEKLHTHDRKKRSPIHVPNCVGKDLRDAVNALNLKGIVPYVKGAGVVLSQLPTYGSTVQSMDICTLTCSFDG